MTEPKPFVTATHAVLFEDDPVIRCDACSALLGSETGGDGTDHDEGYCVQGRGLLVWTRGDERRCQEPPLCAACAAAIGVSALARWEIEEEEG